jgi:hypothetical protein
LGFADTANNDFTILNQYTDGDTRIGAGNGIKMWIKSSGYVGIGTNNPTGTLQVGHTSTTTDTSLRVLAGDSKTATIEAYGSTEGTARLYLGEDSTNGGGIVFNGDDNPNISSSTNAVSFYRRNNGTDYQVFYYNYNSYTVYFTGVINVNEVAGDNGTISDPTFTFKSDTDTGMFLPSIGELGFTTGSTERVRIDGNGYVGIGTTNPLRTLHVNGQTYISSGGLLMSSGLSDPNTRPSFVTGSTAASYEVRAISLSGSSLNDGFLRLRAGGGTGTNQISYIDLSGYSLSSEMNNTIVFGTSGTERVRIKNNGYVGIGTTNPVEPLDINGDTRVRGDLITQTKIKLYGGREFIIYTPSDSYGYSNINSTIYFYCYSGFSGADSLIMKLSHLNYTKTIAFYGNITYTGSLTQSSDDRLKVNEEYITSATETLLKLRPQVYDKLTSVGGDVSRSRKEAGLIAQEVYVHAPELRYILDVPEEFKEDLDNYTNLYNEDPTIDPDYSGWSTSNVMGVDYQSLTPYLIKAVQEKHEELQETKIELQATKIELKETKIELQETKIELNNIKEFLSQKFPGEL